KQYFPDHFMELVSVIIGLGTSYKELDQPKLAISHFEEALRIFENKRQLNHPLIAKILIDLSHLYLLNGDLVKAEASILDSIEISKNNSCRESFAALEVLSNLYKRKADLASSQGHENVSQEMKIMSRAYLKEAYEAAKNRLSKDSPHLLRLYTALMS
ncbi:MAG: tetratricopeptide repeat protein, partial [Alphaproteobacteria bacterium]|nr:tetratricopeptide repeat protein [Alphaproteobacteria bacterium]MBX9805760.1 tetratricopeptide repeat protein [Alphaproteobacteria bacterium]